MRLTIALILLSLVVALAACAVLARRSRRVVAYDVQILLWSLLPPMIGNLIIIATENPFMATIGCYTYYLGMDVTVMALLTFTFDYCSIEYRNVRLRRCLYALVLADMAQLLLNPIFGHAFRTQAVLVAGDTYYALVPLAGQTFHRVVCYGLFFAALLVFLVKTIRTPRVSRERYLVILLVMVLVGGWESFYILSGTPVDRSMIGFGVFGLLIFYFSLYYRPIRLLDRMLARVVSNMNEALLFFDPEGTCIYANAVGMRRLRLKNADDFENVRQSVTQTFADADLDATEDWVRQCTIRRGDTDRFYVLEFRHMEDGRGRPEGTYLSIRDRTGEEMELRGKTYSATHDGLTDLYNKEHLYTCIQRRMQQQPNRSYVVAGFDIKDFKIVNDIFSTDFGDHVLRTLAQWLRDKASTDWIYGRLTGDKFGLFAPVETFDAQALSDSLDHFTVIGVDVRQSVLVHMGVYEVDEPNIDVSVMFDRAFMALSTIKKDFQTRLAFYDSTMRERAVWSQSISTQLSDAIAQRQIRPYLQPMVSADGKVVGAEVLVRWLHPTQGLLSPARFVPVFEENGMIAQIDYHMWRCACEILSDWQRRGIDLFLSVNISPRDFYFMDVYESIVALVREYGVNPGKLRLEITETIMMTDMEHRLPIVERLREAGFIMEMDDFGSGYSSLNMLKDIPVDVLKIDMMFLYKTKDQNKAQTILQNIINLSNDLGLLSLTEGVETSAQYDMLANMGCKLFQGYYFAKPMPVDEFARFVGV